MAGLQFNWAAQWFENLMASGQLTDGEKGKLKALMVLMAETVWDDDFAPLQGGHSVGLGTPNMSVMHANTRNAFATLLAEHPMMRERVRHVADRASRAVRDQINESGAHMACPHYVGASIGPTLKTLLRLQRSGVADLFKDEPRMPLFAEFYMQMLTPPDPRFLGDRKIVSIGDSYIESSPFYGELATGFRPSDPRLAARLMGAWAASGKPHSSFWGPTILRIDEEALTAELRLKSAHFADHLSVLRSRAETPDETAIWFVNGEFYSDHRHADHGSLVIWALGAPLSLHWSPIYSPRVARGYYKATVQPESSLGHAWDLDGPPLEDPQGQFGVWAGSSKHEAFVDRLQATMSRAHFAWKDLGWTREVRLIHADPKLPIVTIRDAFDGPAEKAAEPKVFTLPLMAEGAIETPSGMVTPRPRVHPQAPAAKGPAELASAGEVIPLPAGVSRFGFTGQHGIDFDVYTVSDQPQQALVGQWTTKSQRDHGEIFDEAQHILRVRSGGPFRVVIVPWRKGKRPLDLSVTREGSDIVVTANGKKTVIAEKFQE